LGGAGDRRAPEIVEADIILFEGWFVGVRPINQVPLIPRRHQFLQQLTGSLLDMNAQLQDYLPLWERLDRLILLPS